VANAVAVDDWSAQGVRVGDVLGALAVLRDQAAGGAARTAVMTLVAVAPDDDQAYRATNALRALAGHHPARIVILRPEPDEVAALDARATLYAMELDGHRISFEEVVLAVRGQAARHLDSIVEAFTLSDLPVAVWYVDAIPEAGDPLVPVATAVLLDSRDAADDLRMRALLDLMGDKTVVDLSWIRLGPWRELLSALFDPPANRPWLTRVEAAQITGKVGPRRLLGGWISHRLALDPSRLELTDARHVEIRLRATDEARREAAVFSVERADGARAVAATASGPGVTPLRLGIALAAEPLPTALSTALTHLRHDPTWEEALAAGSRLPS